MSNSAMAGPDELNRLSVSCSPKDHPLMTLPSPHSHSDYSLT